MSLARLPRSRFGRNSVRACLGSPSFGSAMRALRLPVLPALLIAVFVLFAPAGAQAQAPACPCTLFAPSDAPLGDAVAGPPSRDRRQAAVGRGRLHHRAAVLQAAEQHGSARRAPLVSERPASRRGGVHRRDGIGLAGGAARVAGSHLEQHHLYRVLPLAQRVLRVQPGGDDLGIHRAPLHAPADSQVGGNGVFKNGASGFPTDLERNQLLGRRGVHRTPPTDTRPPEISAITPADGSTGVAASAEATVTFDEPMQAHQHHVVHLQPARRGGEPDCRDRLVRRPDPEGNAQPTGAAAARQDLHGDRARRNERRHRSAGNTLAADRSWSFSTPAACPCNVFGPAEAPLGRAPRGQPVEVGMKVRSDEDGFITALRFYKQADNTGAHVGHLWSASGPAPRRGDVHQRDRVRVAGGAAADAGGHDEGHDLRRLLPLEQRTSCLQPGRLLHGRRPPAAARDRLTRSPAATASTATGQADSRRTPSTRATTGWTCRSPEGPASTHGAPRITDVSPAANANAVQSAAKVTATFDEPLNPSTVNSGSVTLEDETGAPVVRTVTYDAAGPQDHADAPGSAARAARIHGHDPERQRRRHRRCREPPGGGRGVELQHLGELPMHGLQAEPRDRLGRLSGPAGRGRHEVPLERGRLHHLAALLQAVEQHGPARGASLVDEWPAARGGDLHQRDGRRAGRRSSCRTRCRSSRTRPTSPPTTRAAATSRSTRATSPRAWTTRR